MNKELLTENELIIKYRPLVTKYAKKFQNNDKFLALNDLIQIGNIGLLKAIRSFDKNKKTVLATLAITCIKNELINATCKRRNLVIPGYVYNEEAPIDININEYLPACLTEVERELITLKLQDYSYSQIGKIKGMSKCKVYNIFKIMYKKIRESNG